MFLRQNRMSPLHLAAALGVLSLTLLAGAGVAGAADQGLPRAAVSSSAAVSTSATDFTSAAVSAAAPGFAVNGGAAFTPSRDVSAGFGATSPFGVPAVLTWDGGSIIRGSGADPGLDYPSQTIALLPRAWQSFNSGSSSATLAFMLADAPLTVDVHYVAGADANVCVVMGGAVDLASGRDAAAVFADLGAYCEARRAAGFRVVVTTFLPRDREGFEAARQMFNGLLRADWASIADGLADIAANPRIGDALDCFDRTYYTDDGVHPNNAGFGVMAEVTAPLLVAIGGSWDMRLRDAAQAWADWLPYASVRAWTLSGGDGAKTVEVEVRDAEGGTAVAADSIVLDTTPPTTTLSGGGDTWSRTPVTLTATADDGPIGSGVAMVQLSVDDGPWAHATQAVVSDDGVHTVRYRAVDAVGNVEETRAVQIRIDATPPQTTAAPDDGSWHAAPHVVAFSATDAAGSGVDHTEHSVDGGRWKTGATATLTTTGRHEVAYRSVDLAGNVEAARRVTVAVDADAPETSLAGADDAWHAAPVPVSLTATDTASGVVLTEYALDDGPWTAGTETVVSDEGAQVLRYRAVDAVGNVEAAGSRTIRIDTRAPTARFLRRAVCRRGGKAALSYAVADPRPGGPTAAVRIAIADSRGRVVKRLTRRSLPVCTRRTATFACRLGTGTYRLTISATDVAGTAQAKPRTGWLTVR